MECPEGVLRVLRVLRDAGLGGEGVGECWGFWGVGRVRRDRSVWGLLSVGCWEWRWDVMVLVLMLVTVEGGC